MDYKCFILFQNLIPQKKLSFLNQYYFQSPFHQLAPTHYDLEKKMNLKMLSFLINPQINWIYSGKWFCNIWHNWFLVYTRFLISAQTVNRIDKICKPAKTKLWYKTVFCTKGKNDRSSLQRLNFSVKRSLRFWEK